MPTKKKPAVESAQLPDTLPAPSKNELEAVKFFVSDSPQLKHIRVINGKAKIWFAFSPFFTLDPKKGQVVKGLLTVKDPQIYEFLKTSPAYGSEWKEVAHPPLVLSGGGTSIVTGAGLGNEPKDDNAMRLARELGELEARWVNPDGSMKAEAPARIADRIGALKQSLQF